MLQSFGLWSKLERWKRSIRGALWAEWKIKKIIVLKCHFLLFDTITMNHVLIGLWRVMKSGFYMTTGDEQLCDWTKKLQSTYHSQTCTKKRSWSLFGGLLLVWSTTAFWIPAKPLQLRSMFSQSMRCMKNCKAYSQHCSTERFQFFSTIPDCTNTSKVEQTFVCSTNKTKLWSFASSAISNWLPLLQASRQLFAGKCFHNEQEAENAFQEFIESWSTDFYATGIKRLISYWQKYVDCNYSYFD